MDTPHDLPDPRDGSSSHELTPLPDDTVLANDTVRPKDTVLPDDTAQGDPVSEVTTPEGLLVGFRSDEATPDAATRARIRARVRAATGDSLFDPVADDVSTAATGPVHADAVGRTSVAAGAAESSRHARPDSGVAADHDPAGPAAVGLIDPEPVAATSTVTALPQRRGRRWLTVLEVAAALLVVAMVAAATLRGGDDQVASGPGALSRDDLIVAAKGTAEQRLTGDAQLYRRVVEAEQRRIDGAPVMVLRTTESWVAADGAGREEASAESVLDESGFDSPSARDRTNATLAPKARVMADAGELDLASFSYVQVRGLPSDGPALLREVEARVRSSDPSGEAAASMLAAVLSLEVAPPTVRAAAVDALFQLGATTVGTVRAPDGRTGEGLVGGDADGGQWVVVLDAKNAKAIAFVSGVTGEVAEADLTRAPSWTSYGASSIVQP